MKAKIATFLIMLLFWTVMSGMFDGFHYTLGVLSCLLVAWFSSDLLFPSDKDVPLLKGLLGMALYLPYLFWQVILANLHVTYIVLHPRMYDKIDPHLVRFRTSLKQPISRVALAQSITLTPGTITANLYDDEFVVYALTRSASADLPGEMERRVAKALEID